MTCTRYHPFSKEHAKRGDESITLSSPGSPGSKAERPFFAFLNYNDAHTPYEVPDPSIPGFGLRPVTSYDRADPAELDTLDKAPLTDS